MQATPELGTITQAMLASAALPESAEFFVSARCVNRMGLGANSDNTSFTELYTNFTLPQAGEI